MNNVHMTILHHYVGCTTILLLWLRRERDMSYSDNAFASLTRPSKMRPGAKVKFDVLLTSYELVSHDQTTLQSIDWAMLVIDEAHKLKNNQSLVGCHDNSCGCYGYLG